MREIKFRGHEGDSIIEYRESWEKISVTVPRLTTLYFDDFLRLRCAVDMLKLGLFPDAKEVTESFAAARAARKYLETWFPFSDKTVSLFAVGDGATPRTAATFAFRSRWKCHSIDPILRREEKWNAVERLICVPKRIEECEWSVDSAVIVAVHSHAPLGAALQAVKAKRRAVVAIACCQPQFLAEKEPDVVYDDWGIWSPDRTVKIWLSV